MRTTISCLYIMAHDFSNNITVKDNTLNGSLVANVVAGLESFTNNDNHV